MRALETAGGYCACPLNWLITVIERLESHLTWCKGWNSLARLKLITVKKLQEAESPGEHAPLERREIEFYSCSTSTTAATASVNKQINNVAGYSFFISWTFIIQKYSTKIHTHKKKKKRKIGFHTVCKPQRRSPYSISTLISKLRLILLVVIVLST